MHRSWLAPTAVVVVLAGSGCTDPMLAGGGDASYSGGLMPAWARDACDPGQGRPSGNMPATAPFAGSADDLITRFEQAFGLDVPDEPSHIHEGSTTYELPGGGTFRINEVRRDDGISQRAPFAEWVHPTAWPGPTSGATVRFADALAALGYPDVAVDGPSGDTVQSMHARQDSEAGSHAVADALFHPTRYDESGWYSSLTLYPAYHDTGTRDVTRERARTIAGDFLACKDGQTGFPEGPFQASGDGRATVLFESLAWELVHQGARDPDHHCGGVGAYVYIDAETGAVLGWSWLLCD